MPTTVTKRPDGTWAITIAGGPCFILLTGTGMAQLVQAMRDARVIAQLPDRRRP